jgi:hypothetical protein
VDTFSANPRAPVQPPPHAHEGSDEHVLTTAVGAEPGGETPLIHGVDVTVEYGRGAVVVRHAKEHNAASEPMTVSVGRDVEL